MFPVGHSYYNLHKYFIEFFVFCILREIGKEALCFPCYLKGKLACPLGEGTRSTLEAVDCYVDPN